MKILVIQQQMIGDVLTSSILFEVLRLKYPNAELHYLINSHTYPVVENNPFIDDFIFFTKNEESSLKALLSFAKTIKAHQYDIVIDVYSKLSSNIISLFSGAKTKISKFKWYTRPIYHFNITEHLKPKTNAGLAVENRLKLLTPILKELPSVIQPKIHLTPSEIESAKQVLIQSGINLSKPFFMISVLGSDNSKTYPFKYMSSIINLIVKETKGQILFNYIPKQETEAKLIYSGCEEKTQEHIHFNVFGKNLREFLCFTKHCTAVIGNEGGAINMAKALNIPTFAIFSPWILKEAWNMFENDTTHVSIHLNDVKPERYKNTKAPLKTAKKNTESWYEQFTPELITPLLKQYLMQF